MSSAAFVTGGGGFAGGHLVAHLRQRGEEPAAPPSSELDLRDSGAVRAAVREELDRHPLVERREAESQDGATLAHLAR